MSYIKLCRYILYHVCICVCVGARKKIDKKWRAKKSSEKKLLFFDMTRFWNRNIEKTFWLQLYVFRYIVACYDKRSRKRPKITCRNKGDKRNEKKVKRKNKIKEKQRMLSNGVATYCVSEHPHCSKSLTREAMWVEKKMKKCLIQPV